MNYVLRTLSYFVVWGTFYGLMLGTWSGTMIFPVMGTLYTLVWGPGIGAACGVLCGLFASAFQARTFHPDVDLDVFRRRLTLGIGLLVAVVGPVMLIATSRRILWNIDERSITYAHGRGFLIGSLMAVIIWGSLSAAYTAQAYPPWLADLKTGQMKPVIDWASWPVPRFMGVLIRQALNPVTLILGTMAGLLQHLRNGSVYFLSRPIQASRVAEGITLGLLGTVIFVLMMAFANAALLVFLKKTVFSEDGLPLSPVIRRWCLVGLAAVLSGVSICGFYASTLAMTAPAVILLTLLHTYNALPVLDEDFDKFKRKDAASQLVAE